MRAQLLRRLLLQNLHPNIVEAADAMVGDYREPDSAPLRLKRQQAIEDWPPADPHRQALSNEPDMNLQHFPHFVRYGDRVEEIELTSDQLLHHEVTEERAGAEVELDLVACRRRAQDDAFVDALHGAHLQPDIDVSGIDMTNE
jgi:hypothetical protein